MKKILYFLLKKLASWTLARYQPRIVAITGSIGKTSTKNAIYRVLSSSFQVRKSYKSYNNQIGVPLTILGFKTPGRDIFAWLKIFFTSFIKVFYCPNYPKVLVLEMGADRPGDLKYLTSFVKPHIAVMTSIGTSHMKYFDSQDELVKEKATLIKALDKDKGKAVLNFDDEKIKEVGLNADAEVIFYGLESKANFKADDLKFNEDGMSFKLESSGNSIPFDIPVLGRSQVYNSLAAVAVGSLFNLTLVEMVDTLSHFKGEKGRCRILAGKKNTTIIDDSYNSAPKSLENALEVLDKINKQDRKVAILGDMLELGKKSNELHKKMGKRAAQIADLLIFVGSKNKYFKQGAFEKEGNRQNRKDLMIKEFTDYKKLNQKVLSLLKPGDTILVKASQGIRLEKTVEKILADSLNPDKLIVRKDKEWKGA